VGEGYIDVCNTKTTEEKGTYLRKRGERSVPKSSFPKKKKKKKSRGAGRKGKGKYSPKWLEGQGRIGCPKSRKGPGELQERKNKRNPSRERGVEGAAFNHGPRTLSTQ